MQVSPRVNKVLLAAAIAVCGAAFAVGGDSAQASAAAADVCNDRYSCPGGPDKCLTLTFPDGSSATCYKTAPKVIGPIDDEELEWAAND